MNETLLFIIAFIPVFIFWVILKIYKLKLNLYRRRHFPDEYKIIGYRIVNVGYIKELFNNPHPEDKNFSRLIMLNKNLLLINIGLICIIIYITALYLK